VKNIETKFQKEFIDHGFGFPVKFMNVTLVKVRGAWTPKVPYNRIAKELLHALAFKPSRLTGNEVRFIRQSVELTLQGFGKRFDVSHVAVLKWEKSGDEATPMAWSMEKDLRLFILTRQGSKAPEMATLYGELEKVRANKSTVIELDAKSAA
jgi:hypothetical protein